MERRRGCAVVALLAAIGLAGLSCTGLVLLPAGLVAGVRTSAALRETELPSQVAPGRLLDTEEGLLHVQTWGNEGPRVVLVHGSAAWSGTWAPVAERLAAQGVQVLAVDLPPFGYSERPPDEDYSRPAQARRIWAAVDAMDWTSVTLVGHSFGAGPATEAAMQALDRAEGLVLVAGALSLDAAPSGLGPLAFRPLREAAVASTFTQPAFFPYGLRSMAYRDAAIDDAWVERYTRPLTAVGTTEAVAGWLPELMAPAPCASLDPEAYRRFDVPTLLLWGDQDTVTPPAQMEAVGALLPEVTMQLLAGVGHLPPVEAPDAVAEHVARFTAR